jgi:hypothetical protein
MMKNKNAPANEYKKLLNEKKKNQPRDENGKFLPVVASVASTVNEDQDFPSSLYSDFPLYGIDGEVPR